MIVSYSTSFAMSLSLAGLLHSLQWKQVKIVNCQFSCAEWLVGSTRTLEKGFQGTVQLHYEFKTGHNGIVEASFHYVGSGCHRRMVGITDSASNKPLIPLVIKVSNEPDCKFQAQDWDFLSENCMRLKKANLPKPYFLLTKCKCILNSAMLAKYPKETRKGEYTLLRTQCMGEGKAVTLAEFRKCTMVQDKMLCRQEVY